MVTVHKMNMKRTPRRLIAMNQMNLLKNLRKQRVKLTREDTLAIRASLMKMRKNLN